MDARRHGFGFARSEGVPRAAAAAPGGGRDPRARARARARGWRDSSQRRGSAARAPRSDPCLCTWRCGGARAFRPRRSAKVCRSPTGPGARARGARAPGAIPVQRQRRPRISRGRTAATECERTNVRGRRNSAIAWPGEGARRGSGAQEPPARTLRPLSGPRPPSPGRAGVCQGETRGSGRGRGSGVGGHGHALLSL